MQRCCCVSFHHSGGEYSNTAMGHSLFDVAANALEFFCAPHWKGPRPQRDTILDVTILGDDQASAAGRRNLSRSEGHRGASLRSG
jgi:hypothetical protein